MMWIKKLLILVALLLVLLGGCFSSSADKKPTELQGVLNSLTSEQLHTLETFFRAFMTESQAGYALYGEKPICVDAFPVREEGTIFLAKWIHIFSTQLKEGALLWKKLGLNKYSKNHILFVCEKPVFEKWIDIVLINKQYFLKVVEANLSLFQYVLGPKVTPNELLKKMTDPKETFHSVLRDDRVLIGIVLGYGTQNALLGSRSENIYDSATTPTFGFISLQEEISWLKQGEIISTKMSEEKTPFLPWFACYQNKETEELINRYKTTQKTIAKALRSERFLEQVLSRFFEAKVSLHFDPANQVKAILPKRDELTEIVAQGIWYCIDPNERDSDYIRAFFDGLSASEEGRNPLPDSEYSDLIIRFTQAADSYSSLDPSFMALRKEVAYYAGLRVWDHFKLGKDFYSFNDIMKFLSKAVSGESAFSPIDEQTDEILTHLHSILYQRQKVRLPL